MRGKEKKVEIIVQVSFIVMGRCRVESIKIAFDYSHFIAVSECHEHISHCCCCHSIAGHLEVFLFT